MIIYRRAEEEDFAQLKEVWNVVFNEDPTFLKKFFLARFDSANIYVAEEDGTIVAALHALSSSYTKKGVTKPCYFIVGVATVVEYRKQGIMGKLLDFVHDIYDEPLMLFPAVRPYYEKHGYYSTSSVIEYPLPASLANDVLQEGFSYTALNEIYTLATYNSGALNRDSLAWSFLTDGYETVHVQGAYAFLLKEKVVEAMAVNEKAARRLVGILVRRGLTTIPVLADSPFTHFLSDGKEVLMGMASRKKLSGIYIAEQY